MAGTRGPGRHEPAAPARPAAAPAPRPTCRARTTASSGRRLARPAGPPHRQADPGRPHAQRPQRARTLQPGGAARPRDRAPGERGAALQSRRALRRPGAIRGQGPLRRPGPRGRRLDPACGLDRGCAGGPPARRAAGLLGWTPPAPRLLRGPGHPARLRERGRDRGRAGPGRDSRALLGRAAAAGTGGGPAPDPPGLDRHPASGPAGGLRVRPSDQPGAGPAGG